MPQTWSELTAGSAIYTNPELSRKARFISAKQVRCHEAVDSATEFNLGKKSGDRVGFRLVGRLTTLANTALGEGTPVPLDAPPIYEGTGIVYRYARGINWTGTRADLDRLDVQDMNIRTLREHAARTLNKIIYDALIAARSFCYVPTAAGVFTTNGSPSGTATEGMTLKHLRLLSYNLRKNNVPFFDGESYLFIISEKNRIDLVSDTATNGFVDVAKYASKGNEECLSGEIGTCFNFRFVADNDVLSNDTGTNDLGEGIICGYEAMKEIMVYPTHFRANMNYGNDFGNQGAICWQGMFGFKSPWNFTTHGDGRICHYTSAA